MDESKNAFHWGPTNPHPLSKMRTELVWDGKYDEFGNRREVDVASCAMPMQKIETVDEPRQRAAAEGYLELFEKQLGGKKHDDFRNRLIWGDNKLVMASLLKEFKGRIDLIYIDPPFDVGADFTMDVPIGDGNEEVGKDQSTLEMVAYRDMWGKGTDSYLHMMYERLMLMKELLSEKGSIFVHCDWHMSFFLRCLLEEVFGKENFQNEIYWYYYNKLHGARKRVFPRATDSILYYLKNREAGFTYRHIKEPRDKAVTKLKYSFIGGKIVNDKGEDGKTITYESTERQIDNVWRIRMLQPADKTEFLGYSTQKPEDIAERIITAVTDEGDLVADFFCGSGTTGAVAERMGRRWIMSDFGRFSIHTSRKRIIERQRKLHDDNQPYRAFDVYNLGRYERQWWQKDRLKGAEEEHRRIVLEFFKAEILSTPPNPLLHGRKAGAFCHVDGIDGLFTRDEARAVAEATVQAGGREVYCLAWEFEMELRTHCLALEAEFKIKMKLVPIPREIMEKNRKSPPPFLEMAVLEAESVVRTAGGKKSLDVKLTKFLPSLAEVGSKELEALKERAVKSGFDFIDFWAVDFDWHPGKPFNHHWQDYRTRKDRSLKTVSDAGHTYEKAGKHTICVKVVDVFGCDTSITIDVNV
ncbi:MAG: site-specific DNA-methyltransferase [Pedosphaera sp.]|nr:site-specific DNA-methyltransferase [Pedosphaera sp.]